MNGPANTATEEPAATDLGGSGPADQVAVSAAEGYARWASTYDQDPNPLLAREERHLLPLLVDLRNKRILDLACGTGRWLEKLAAAGGESAVGIDRSEPMLRVAARKGLIVRRLTRAVCESLPFRSGVFDLTICSFALGHLEDLGEMARELERVTRPAGDLFVSDLHPDAYELGWRAGFRDRNTAVQIETVPRSADETVQALGAHGFECLTQVPLWLGEPEKPLFARAGKSDQFARACQSPAVLVFHFRRINSPRSVEGRNKEAQ